MTEPDEGKIGEDFPLVRPTRWLYTVQRVNVYVIGVGEVKKR